MKWQSKNRNTSADYGCAKLVTDKGLVVGDVDFIPQRVEWDANLRNPYLYLGAYTSPESAKRAVEHECEKRLREKEEGNG